MMSSDQKPNSYLTTITIVFVVALLLLGIQMRQESTQFYEFSDQEIITAGHRRLSHHLKGNLELKITCESVIRPGRDGGDFGYQAQYRFLNADGEWAEGEFYVE